MTSARKTIRRDRLLKMAREGKLVAVESYSFDDMAGEKRFDGELPVRVKADHGDFVQGYFNLSESVFSGKCGHATQQEDGTIWLYVHSNCSYTFRVKG